MTINMNWPAVRAFARLWAPLAENFEVAARADAGFDGGEWSGPSNANKEQEAWEALVARVAALFGLPPEELARQLQHAHHHEFDCHLAKLD